MARWGKPWWSLTHVVLSHFHTDHFGDLPHLLFALKWATPEPRSAPLTVVGPPGLLERVDGLHRAHGDFIVDPGCPLQYEEVDRNGHWAHPPDFEIAFNPTRHTDSSVAMRVEHASGALGYTGDTGPLPELEGFFHGVDVLVSECAYSEPPPADIHLTPAQVAQLARGAEPELLLLTHLYPPLRADTVPELVGEAGYGGEVVCPSDGDSYPL